MRSASARRLARSSGMLRPERSRWKWLAATGARCWRRWVTRGRRGSVIGTSSPPPCRGGWSGSRWTSGTAVTAGTVVARLAPLPLDARSRQQAEAALAASRDLERMSRGQPWMKPARRSSRRNRIVHGRSGWRPAARSRRQIWSDSSSPSGPGGGKWRRRRPAPMAAAHDVESAQSALLASGAVAGGRTAAAHLPGGGRVLAIPERSERTVQPGQRCWRSATRRISRSWWICCPPTP